MKRSASDVKDNEYRQSALDIRPNTNDIVQFLSGPRSSVPSKSQILAEYLAI
jgi:hypothetical protein